MRFCACRWSGVKSRRESSTEDELILWHDECCARVHRRAQQWDAEQRPHVEAVLTLPSLEISLPLGELYAGVSLGARERL
jgi:hypothetical protein